MSLHGSFTLEFEEGYAQQVVVWLDSPIGSAGPIMLSEAEVDRLADVITSMFELLRLAQVREFQSGAVGTAKSS
ncbi:MAG: hypothetical protein QM778_37215 [Myxococcales bacterium]